MAAAVRRILMMTVVGLSLACPDKREQVAAPQVAPPPPPAAPVKTTVEAFHDVLAPVWHTDDEAKRNESACSTAASLHTLASRLVGEPAPRAATPAYPAQTVALEKAVTSLESACSGAERTSVGPALSNVHDAFHAVSACAGR